MNTASAPLRGTCTLSYYVGFELFKEIWEKVRCHPFYGICHTVSGKYAFQLYRCKSLILYTVKLGQDRIGGDLLDFLFNRRGIIVMDKNDIRFSCQNFFIADRYPITFREIIEDILASGKFYQKGLKVSAGACENAIIAAVVNQHFDRLFSLDFVLYFCNPILLILNEFGRRIFYIKDFTTLKGYVCKISVNRNVVSSYSFHIKKDRRNNYHKVAADGSKDAVNGNLEEVYSFGP